MVFVNSMRARSGCDRRGGSGLVTTERRVAASRKSQRIDATATRTRQSTRPLPASVLDFTKRTYLHSVCGCERDREDWLAHTCARSHLRVYACACAIFGGPDAHAKTFNEHAIFSVEFFLFMSSVCVSACLQKKTGYLCVCAVGAQGQTHARTNFECVFVSARSQLALEIKLVVAFFFAVPVRAGTTKTSVPKY